MHSDICDLISFKPDMMIVTTTLNMLILLCGLMIYATDP